MIEIWGSFACGGCGLDHAHAVGMVSACIATASLYLGWVLTWWKAR